MSAIDKVPEHPALFRTLPARPGRRVARGFLSVAVTAALAFGAAAIMVRFSGRTDLPLLTLVGLWGLAGVVLAAMFALWGAIAGGWLPDLLLGTRLVRVADGRRAIAAGLGRSLLVGALGAVSLGIAPLLLTLLTRDANGRVWLDRISGTALLDVRAGRNVLVDPVSQAELDIHFTPKVKPRPAIIEVHPGQSSHLPPIERSATGVPTEIPTVVGGRRVPRGSHNESVTTLVSVPILEPTLHPAASTADAPVWLLTFDTGEEHPLQGSALVGRQPVPQAGYRGADLVRISDPSLTVSGTHLAVTSNEVGVWVEDLGSTNGSEVRAPSGRTQAIPVHVRTAVARGSRVRLGDRWMTVDQVRA